MSNEKYYYLKKGEIIQDGDEVEMSNNYNDPAKWQPAAAHTIGTPAPDPQFMAHRTYRRIIKPTDEITSAIEYLEKRAINASAYSYNNLKEMGELLPLSEVAAILEMAKKGELNKWLDNMTEMFGPQFRK